MGRDKKGPETMMKSLSPARIFIFIVTLLTAINAAGAQQPATARPPDPAAAPQQAATA